MQQDQIRQDQIRLIRDLKYKFYIFFIIVLILIIYPYFQEFEKKVDDLSIKKVNLEKSLNNKEDHLKYLEDVNKKINYIQLNKKEIVNCINNTEYCKLDINKEELSFFRLYIMFSKFKKDKKMDYNQKEILSDIVNFINKTNGVINVISFSDVKKVPKLKNIYAVDITLNADFSNYHNFKKFLDNVENKVLDNVHNLYYIKNLSYNILNYTKPQTVTINMSVYFYK